MSLQSVHRTFDIIEFLSRKPAGVNLGELSAALSLPVSTVYRIAADLVKKGYLEKNSDLNIYKIGLKFIDLSSLFLNNLEIKTEAHPFLMDLSRHVGFPVFLATLLEGEVCYIDRVAPMDADQGYSIIGQKRSVFSTALGKALILNWQEKDVMALIHEKGMARYTPFTITDPVDFWKEISISRERGWTRDHQEDRLDFQCIGVPVYDYKNNIVASISASWDTSHFGKTDILAVAALVQAAAVNISARLGSRFNSDK